MTQRQEAAEGAVAETSVVVSIKVYGIDVIKKAAYRFLDRGVVTVAPRGDRATCTIRFPTPKSHDDAKRAADDFLTEVIDQDLRRIVANETTEVRNAVLAYAFSKTGLQNDG